MGNKQASAGSHASSTVSFGSEEAHTGEDGKQKGSRGQRTRKVVRQQSVAGRKITISKSAITEVDDIGTRDASEIVLVGKELSAFPESIVSSTHLVLLNLCKNAITELPDEIGNLSSLARLYLAGNLLTSLPETLGGLSALEELVLADNPKLNHLPDALTSCTALQTLNIAKCRFRSIPDCVTSMPSLLELDVSHNKLDKADLEGIGNSTMLRTLRLNDCRLTELPSSLSQLVFLRELEASHNALTSLPSSGLEQLTNLTQLELEDNSFGGVPIEVTSILSLRHLNLLDNPEIRTIPSSLHKLRKLKTLLIEWGLLANLNLREYQDKSIGELMDYLRLLDEVEQKEQALNGQDEDEEEEEGEEGDEEEAEEDVKKEKKSKNGKTSSAAAKSELDRILLENYARIVEKNKTRQMSKSDFYRAMGLEGFSPIVILERMFAAFDSGEGTSGDDLVSLEEYQHGVKIILEGTLEQKAKAFMRFFAAVPDVDELAIDEYIVSFKSYQSVISMSIMLQEKAMAKKTSEKKRGSVGRLRPSSSAAPAGNPGLVAGSTGSSGALKRSEKEEIQTIVTAIEFWRTPEMTRLLDEAQDTYDAIAECSGGKNSKKTSEEEGEVVTEKKLVNFMKLYEGNEVEEFLKSIANWLIHGIFQSPELLVAKAKEHMKMNQQEIALELLKDAIEAAPNRINSYEELMQFYRTQKMYDKAIKVGKMALTVDEKALSIVDLIGRICGDAGKLTEAVAYYQQVIDANPDAAPTIYRQAWYQVALGKFKEAQANVLILDKLNYEAGAAIIRYLISRSSKDPAALVDKLGKRALRLNPENQFLHSLTAIPYDPKEDTKAIFG